MATTRDFLGITQVVQTGGEFSHEKVKIVTVPRFLVCRILLEQSTLVAKVTAGRREGQGGLVAGTDRNPGEVKAAFLCCKAVVPAMAKQRRGSIVVVSSSLSRHSDTGFVAHCTTKAGLDGFVRTLATELGPEGIRVNTIAPGLTRAPQSTRRRVRAR